MTQQLQFSLELRCNSCVERVRTVLKTLNLGAHGLSNPRVDFTQKKLVVQFDAKASTQTLPKAQSFILASMSEHGIHCTVSPAINNQHWLFGSMGLAFGLSIMIFPMIFSVGLSFPGLIALGSASTLLTLILGYQSFKNAYLSTRYRQTLTMDTLFSISTLAILAISMTALFVPGLPMMFEAGLMIFGFRHIGLGIEALINRKNGVKENFSDRVQRTVVLEKGDKKELSQVKPGDVLILQCGDLLPVDGCFLDSAIYLKNKLMTGHNQTKLYQPNQKINAGAIIDGEKSSYRFKALAAENDSQLARLDQCLLTAQENKAEIEYYTDKVLQYFIPAVITLALISGLSISFFISPAAAIQCAAAVLVTACPCTLGMIVPLTMKIGMQQGLKQGVIFLSRQAIEAAQSITTVVFDLNGTLTRGLPQVSQCQLLTDMPEDQLWQSLLLLEKDATHPTGQCLASYARENMSSPMADATLDGVSVESLRNGRIMRSVRPDSSTYIIGNRQCMFQQGIEIDMKNQSPLIYLAKDETVIAQFSVVDTLRQDARFTLDHLQKQGKSIYVFTGADRTTAKYYADILGIEDTHLFANQSPAQKAGLIMSLQNDEKIAMVGDGDNDAIALQQSDLGIAIHSQLSDSMAAQRAQVIISDQTLNPINHIFQVADQTMSVLKQNLWFSFAYNAVALLLTGGVLVGLGFSINPAIGAGLMVLQTSLILGNTYRLTSAQTSSEPTKSQPACIQGKTLVSLSQVPATELNLSPSPDPIQKETSAEENKLTPCCQNRGNLTMPLT